MQTVMIKRSLLHGNSTSDSFAISPVGPVPMPTSAELVACNLRLITLPETGTHEKRPSQKESSLSTASFRGYISCRECITSDLKASTLHICLWPFGWLTHDILIKPEFKFLVLLLHQRCLKKWPADIKQWTQISSKQSWLQKMQVHIVRSSGWIFIFHPQNIWVKPSSSVP